MNGIIEIIKKIFNNSNSVLNNTNKTIATKPRKSNIIETHNMFFEDEWKEWFNNDKTIFEYEYSCFQNNACPNCGVVLDKQISSSKKCQECNKKMVVRTNYKTKQKLIIGEDKIDSYNKLDFKRKEINFCEQHLQKMSYSDSDLINEFRKLKEQKPGQSVRDYFWMFCMNKSNEITDYGYKTYMNAMKKPHHQKVLEIYDAIFLFQRANVWFNYMVSLVEFEKKDNILMTMLPRAIHLGISVEMLYLKGLGEKVDEIRLTQLNCGKVLINYLERNNISLDEFKDIYIAHATNLIIPTITPEEAWPYVKKGIILYRKL